jgi:hypothetical protein
MRPAEAFRQNRQRQQQQQQIHAVFQQHLVRNGRGGAAAQQLTAMHCSKRQMYLMCRSYAVLKISRTIQKALTAHLYYFSLDLLQQPSACHQVRRARFAPAA